MDSPEIGMDSPKAVRNEALTPLPSAMSAPAILVWQKDKDKCANRSYLVPGSLFESMATIRIFMDFLKAQSVQYALALIGVRRLYAAAL